MNVLLCPMSDPGYLYPAIAVGLELRRRGASVHVLGRDRAAPVLAGTGIPFLAAGTYGAQRAFMVGRWPCEALAQSLAIQRAAREVQADVLVTSVLCLGALLAAENLDLPVVVIGLAAYLWNYQANGGAEPAHLALRSWLTRDMVRFYDMAREQAGLPARRPGAADYPLTGTALLLRGDPVLEYPGAVLPERVHHVGPCSWEPRSHPAELGEVLGRLDQVGKPLVYVHLGRVFGGANPWPRLNAAFTNGPFQAVVELGRSGDPQPAPGADLVVVRKPWMGPLIDRAGLVLTSGTSAPVLNALLRGRALGVSPCGSEQPLLAAACVRAGVATYIPDELDRDPVEVLRSVWRDAGLRARASELGGRLAAADGGGRAGDVIQFAVTGRLGVVSGACSAGGLPPAQPVTPTCPRSFNASRSARRTAVSCQVAGRRFRRSAEHGARTAPPHLPGHDDPHILGGGCLGRDERARRPRRAHRSTAPHGRGADSAGTGRARPRAEPPRLFSRPSRSVAPARRLLLHARSRPGP